MASVLEKSAIESYDAARFWIWVDKSDGCWNWVGNTDSGGYGRFRISAGRFPAHRIAWVIMRGHLDEHLDLDHQCHNITCVNPDHLKLATAKQNAENLLPVRAASGYRGVYPSGKKWSAMVKHNGTIHRSGKHLTPESANEAAIALRNKLFTHNILDRVS